jgi:hypothetical protein
LLVDVLPTAFPAGDTSSFMKWVKLHALIAGTRAHAWIEAFDRCIARNVPQLG